MEYLSSLNYTLYTVLLLILMFIVLVVLLHVVRRVNRLVRKSEEERIVERIRFLEEDLEQYISRSHRRLDIFKRVIDGVDHVIQNVKGVLAEEEAAEMRTALHHEKKDLLEHDQKQEAEVIRLDKHFDED